jgi:thioredoxin-like negative regulator of GroEL
LVFVLQTEEAENFPNLKTKVVLFFWANWYEPSKPGGQMDQVLAELAIQFEDISFFKIEAEACPIISSKYAVEVVPTFVFLEQSGKLVGKVEGANPAEVASSCRGLSSTDSSLLMSSSSETLEDRMQKLINSAPVMLFMKGDPSAPKCKFSRQVYQHMQSCKLVFS